MAALVFFILVSLCFNFTEGKSLAELSQEVDTIYFELNRLIHNHARTMNYALGKPAFQSSIYKNEFNRGPGAAVDGSMSGDFNTRTCIHTSREPNPWWMVDFGANIYIGRVVIKNRADCCGERLKDFKISVGQSENGNFRTFGKFNGVAATGEIITVRNLRKRFGRYLKIEQSGPPSILGFCEVQVFYE